MRSSFSGCRRSNRRVLSPLFPPAPGQPEPPVGLDVARGIPRHEHGGRIVETGGEKPAAVVDAGRIRSADAGQAALAQPGAGGGEERVGGLVIGEIEKAEEAGPVAVVFVVQPVADGGDASDRASVAPGDEGGEFSRGAQEGRVAPEETGHAAGNRRDKLRGGAEDVLAAVLKLPQFGPGAAGVDLDAFGGFPRRRAGRHRLRKCGVRGRCARRFRARSRVAPACGSPCSWCG